MIYFTSDLHFGHRNIINFARRPWPDVESMDRMLAINWNELVRPDDTVYVLGDFAMGKIAETLPIARKLNGNKFLVPGNHDRCWPGHLEGPDKADAAKISAWKAKYEEVGFTVLPTEVVLEIQGRTVRLCHFPYRTVVGQYDDRFGSMHPVDDGLPLLHGHIHQTWRSKPGMVNVGIDVWRQAPVSVERLFQELDSLAA